MITEAARAPVIGAVLDLPIDDIALNPYQPRRVFDQEALSELAGSIDEYGVLQPVSVRLINGTSYELVAGERRLRASRMAGQMTIPAVLVSISDRDSAIIALIENLQRQDLNFFEEAEGLMNLVVDYGFTQEQLARRIGKKQSTVANKLRLLKLPAAIKLRLLESGLTERHARALLRLEGEDLMEEALERVLNGCLNVSQTEDLVERMLSGAIRTHRRKARVIKPFVRDLRLFTNTVKQALDVMNRSGLTTTYDVEEGPEGCLIKIGVVY